MADLFVDFGVGWLGGDVDRHLGIFVGDGFDDAKGVLLGDSFSPIQNGWKVMFLIVIVLRLVLGIVGSGLSLGHLFVLPFGGLKPKLGRVTILSIFGFM